LNFNETKNIILYFDIAKKNVLSLFIWFCLLYFRKYQKSLKKWLQDLLLTKKRGRLKAVAEDVLVVEEAGDLVGEVGVAGEMKAVCGCVLVYLE
jgi:predicted RNA-binding protein